MYINRLSKSMDYLVVFTVVASVLRISAKDGTKTSRGNKTQRTFRNSFFGCIGSQLQRVRSWMQRADFSAHRLGCSTACGILVPLLGNESMAPALEGRFLTTGPPEKSCKPNTF